MFVLAKPLGDAKYFRQLDFTIPLNKCSLSHESAIFGPLAGDKLVDSSRCGEELRFNCISSLELEELAITFVLATFCLLFSSLIDPCSFKRH